ncbi:ABC transporter permease [Ferrimonas marina]|uniref:ABC-type transport system, involved in lipoprotein release, permease component n=1 Tax=Ferrimonas marina TaxID=299255 RepID=A0A1M5YSG1_9GAMM|nr:ABC transporter permease [Ferrimonas marina]SHI14879.1 ABC-type transport system, involved in lipoprotein release, permease component [Ferrimonas marina]
MLIRLAWRNLWRQKRRTLLTAAALALALALSLFMRSLQEGTYSNNIDNAARFATGLVQIQHPEYQESQGIDDLVPKSADFIAPARALPSVSHLLPRLESFALAAGEQRSKGALVMAGVPSLENDYAKLGEKLVAGEFLEDDDNQVLVGEGLAQFLELAIGDEIVLYGQGYRGQTAAGLYRIKGLLRFPVPGLDNQLVYLPLPLAQQLYSTGDLISAWVLHTHTLAQLSDTEQQLKALYPDQAVRDWQDLAPEMAQQILMDKAGGLFMMYLLYGVVGFGLFATLLMMTLERQREFAVMLATGMLRGRLLALVMIESLFIAALGVAMGLLLATPVLLYLAHNPIQMTGDAAQMMLELGWDPILPALVDPGLFLDQIGIVLALLALCLLYPLWRIHRLELVSALKGGAHAR